MLEKYLHSKGAVFYDEGCTNEAINCFQQAISVNEKPYTRYHLSLALLQMGDLGGALAEISRAIDLNPAIPEYHYQRSLLWKAAGDAGRSEEDRDRALALDPNYKRIDIIRYAIKAAHQAFYSAVFQALPDPCGIANSELQNIVRTVEEARQSVRETFEQASCTLECPSYCCYFSEVPLLHGIYIGPWKLLAIRRFLRESGVSEKAFLDKVPFVREEHFTQLLPPHIVVREGGREFVFCPKRNRPVLGKRLLGHLPKGRDYRSLLWINEKARPCAFLSNKRCGIHDLADEPGLPSCKEFLCLTGFGMVVLKHLGIVGQETLKTRKLQDLNGIAVEALIILYNRLYGNPVLKNLEAATEDALRQALETDPTEDTGKINNCVKVYRGAKERHDRLFGIEKDRATREIRTLFECPLP